MAVTTLRVARRQRTLLKCRRRHSRIIFRPCARGAGIRKHLNVVRWTRDQIARVSFSPGYHTRIGARTSAADVWCFFFFFQALLPPALCVRWSSSSSGGGEHSSIHPACRDAASIGSSCQSDTLIYFSLSAVSQSDCVHARSLARSLSPSLCERNNANDEKIKKKKKKTTLNSGDEPLTCASHVLQHKLVRRH